MPPSKSNKPDGKANASKAALSTAEERIDFPDLIQPCPPGLPNLGNTCYITATLQCLLSIHPLVKWLLPTNVPINPAPLSPIIQGIQLTPILAKLVRAIFCQNFQAELEEFRNAVGELAKVIFFAE